MSYIKTEEHRANISAALKGRRPWNCCGENNPAKRPEIRMKMSKSHKGKPCPWLGGKNNPMRRLELRFWLKENHPMKRPEIRAKISGMNSSAKRPEVREKQRQNAFKQWSNPEIRNLMVKNSRLASHITPNKFEQRLNSILQEIQPNNWQFVGDGKVIIEGFCPDFINVNGQKKIIECFGDYWHNRIGVKEKDQRRIEAYEKLGFKTLVIWEHELSQNSEVIEKIKNFIRKEVRI